MNGFRTISQLLGMIFFGSSLYAQQLGQVVVADPMLGTKTIVYEQIGDYAVVEGDILLGKVSRLSRQGAVITPKVGGSRWPHGIIPYEISNDMPIDNAVTIAQAIAYWKKNSYLEFVALNEDNRSDYPDYISFVPASGTLCASYVGRQKGMQLIQLSPRCTQMNTVHEIGHALGFWHEQSRADRDAYVRIEWDNILEGHQYNFDQHLSDGKDFGDYDYQSIMHYGPLAFSKNGKPTIIPLMDVIDIGQRHHLSDKDIAAVKAMYPEGYTRVVRGLK